MDSLTAQFGTIDIYLFDQLLRGRIESQVPVFDAGCGSGRNLVFLLRHGHPVCGVDADPRAVDATRRLAASLAPALPPGNFRHEPIETNSFEDAKFPVVLASAVLHFANSDAHFTAMLHGAWRLLAPGGLFFCRLASTIGMEDRVQKLDGRRCLLPDGSQRYLVDEPLLLGLTEQLGGTLLDPLKTTVVQDQRSMTTWVARKNR